MITDHEIYKCKLCGMLVDVVHGGEGTLVCCGEQMVRLVENSTDAAKEKHVPVLSRVLSGFKVVVGSTPHPMEERHFIEWIELIADGVSCRQNLQPGKRPEAEFNLTASAVTVRAHCNLHGLWKA